MYIQPISLNFSAYLRQSDVPQSGWKHNAIFDNKPARPAFDPDRPKYRIAGRGFNRYKFAAAFAQHVADDTGNRCAIELRDERIGYIEIGHQYPRFAELEA